LKTTFSVQVLDFANILEIAGARTSVDDAALLDALEFGERSGLSDADLREMCILSLQDMDPEEAAYTVLKHDLGSVLRDGQLRNMANEMLDEKLWEEHADSSLHERLFNVGSLLYAAFPRTFPKPDAVRVVIEITAGNDASKACLLPSPDETLLVRLLADGMDDHAVLHRLYGDELAGSSFPNAAEVVWIATVTGVEGNAVTMEIVSSGYWLDALEDTEAYESSAYADK